MARARAGAARLLPLLPPSSGLAAVARGGVARRACAALHRRHAPHLGGIGLRAVGARHAGLRARVGRRAGGRGGRASAVGAWGVRGWGEGPAYPLWAAEL